MRAVVLGGLMDLQYATAENLASCQSLFDVMVLLWWELETHEGTVRTELERQRQADDGDGPTASSIVDRAISETWSREPLLAGNKDIDGQVRDAVILVFEKLDPAQVLLHVLMTIEKRCADIRLRRQRILNRNFRDLASVYLNPPQQLRSFIQSPAPLPPPIGEWPLARLHSFSIVPALPNDVVVNFIDPPHTRLIGPATDGLVFGVGDHCSEDDSLDIEILGEGGGRQQCRVHLRPGTDARERMKSVVESMNAEGIHVGVLPELSTNPELVDVAARTLRDLHDESRGANSLRLLVAGTFHEASGPTRVSNIGHVLGSDGSPLWAQRKMTPYAWPEAEPTHQEALDMDRRVLNVCDAWFGRLAVAICLDYLCPDVREVARRLNVSCFLVPALTPKTGEFSKTAHDNVRVMEAAAIVSNAYCQLTPPDPDDGASLLCLPMRGREADVVIRVPVVAGPSFRARKI